MRAEWDFNKWVSCSRPNRQASVRLFCFPYAGGGISAFHTWSNGSLADVEISAIQLPGRESRLHEAPYTTLLPLVKAVTSGIHSYQDLPYAFYGHSLGALIAFEVARELQRREEACPVHLFVAALRSPSIPNPNPPLHPLPDATFVSEIERLYGGIPGPVKQHDELMQLLLPALRADVKLLEDYVFVDGQPLGCPISAFGGLEDKTVNRDELARWREQTRSSFTLRMLPGDHFFLRSARDLLLPAIAQDLRLFLGSQCV